MTTIRAEAEPFVAVPNWLWQDPAVTHADVRVWMALKHFWNRRTGQCNPAHDSIAKKAQVSVSGVRNSIAHLAEIGVIRVVPDLKGGRRSNHYELAWTDPQVARHSVTSDLERASLSDTRASLSDAPGASLSSDNQEEPEQEHARDEIDTLWHLCRSSKKFAQGSAQKCIECQPVRTIEPKEGIL